MAVGIKINKAEIPRCDMVIAPYARFDKGTTYGTMRTLCRKVSRKYNRLPFRGAVTGVSVTEGFD